MLVTSATSRLGSRTALHLLRYGHVEVRALVRRASSPDAIDLGRRGAYIVEADPDDPLSLEAAFDNVAAVCCIHRPEGTEDVDAQARFAMAIAGAARAAETPHFVYLSEAAAELPSDHPHLEARRRVEQAIRDLGLVATILRPAPLYEQFDAPWPARLVLMGALRSALGQGRALPMIAETDVAWFAARACERPMALRGVSFEVAGDRLTVDEIAAAHKRATGSSLRGLPLPGWLPRPIGSEMSGLIDWARSHAFGADVRMLRRQHPNLLSLERWFKRRADRARSGAVQLAL
ncbi:MAG: NmrA family NAD(P)-binding protein [Polyangiaceae bacterium]|nr:NmrA family NAD(P)-binding protein [Polyangiaceae bacterium]